MIYEVLCFFCIDERLIVFIVFKLFYYLFLEFNEWSKNVDNYEWCV